MATVSGEVSRRPAAAYLIGLDGPSVELPAWACDWLERQTNLARRRVELRGADPAVDDVLVAVREAAMSWRNRSGSDSGTSLAVAPEPAARSDRMRREPPCSVSAAADLIGITDRAVRRAIRSKRLPAHLIGTRYVVEAEDARAYREQRRRRTG